MKYLVYNRDNSETMNEQLYRKLGNILYWECDAQLSNTVLSLIMYDTVYSKLDKVYIEVHSRF